MNQTDKIIVVFDCFAIKIRSFFEFADAQPDVLTNSKMLNKHHSRIFPKIITPSKSVHIFARIAF